MELYSATHMIVMAVTIFAITGVVCWAIASLSMWACDTSYKRRAKRFEREMDRINREFPLDDDEAAR